MRRYMQGYSKHIFMDNLVTRPRTLFSPGPQLLDLAKEVNLETQSSVKRESRELVSLFINPSWGKTVNVGPCAESRFGKNIVCIF